jgi:hypothetical protein
MEDIGTQSGARGCSFCQFPLWTFTAIDERDNINGTRYNKLQMLPHSGCFGCQLLRAALDLVAGHEDREEFTIYFFVFEGQFSFYILGNLRSSNDGCIYAS